MHLELLELYDMINAVKIHWLVYLFLEREKQLLLIFRDMTEENRKYQQEFFTLKDKNDDVWIRHYGGVLTALSPVPLVFCQQNSSQA